MLGLLGLLLLALGAAIAGGGVFNWEFFFSDGYREHGWARSLGREGARGVLMLLGGVLLIAGFVSQVVDAASQPIADRQIVDVLPNDDSTVATQATGVSDPAASRIEPAPNDSTRAPPSTAAGPGPGRATTQRPAGTPPPNVTAAAPHPPAPNAPSSAQAVTIWSPDVAQEDTQILLFLQYRFEAGHQPRPDGQYFWVIDLQGVVQKIAFEGGSLEKQGQFTHVFNASAEGAHFSRPWSTWIETQVGQKGRQISNRLDIEGADVRSVPLSAP